MHYTDDFDEVVRKYEESKIPTRENRQLSWLPIHFEDHRHYKFGRLDDENGKAKHPPPKRRVPCRACGKRQVTLVGKFECRSIEDYLCGVCSQIAARKGMKHAFADHD